MGNAFFNFLKEFRNYNKHLKPVESAKQAGHIWRTMSDEEKEQYVGVDYKAVRNSSTSECGTCGKKKKKPCGQKKKRKSCPKKKKPKCKPKRNPCKKKKKRRQICC